MPARISEKEYILKHNFDLTLDQVRTKKTHCGRGHRFTPENVRLNGKGQRLCWICEGMRRKLISSTPMIGYTHCINNHEIKDENIVLDNKGTTKRCKVCMGVRKRNYTYGSGAGDWYHKNIDSRNGICEICKKACAKLVLDHDHSTGKVRGIICDSCNKFLGQLEKRMNIINTYFDYITQGVY